MNEKKTGKSFTQWIRHFFHIAVRSVWFWLVMLLPLGGILYLCAEKIPGFADLYCGGVYRFISLLWNNLSGILPFSLGEIIVVLVVPSLLAYIIFVFVCVIRAKKKRLRAFFKGVLRLFAVVSLTLFLFVTNCGINYYCTDAAQKIGLDVHPTSKEELYEVCVYLADSASYYRSRIPENSEGVCEIDISSLYSKSAEASNSLSEKYDNIPGGYSSPKGVMLSRGMSYLNITGVYFPFTFEANVNTDVPSFSVPFTMCHELAHVRGIMHEEDANFISYLSCIESDDDIMNYSGNIMAMMYASNKLYSADKELYREFFTHISKGVYNDLEYYSDYWKEFETPVAEAASNINDKYLKSNSQKSGVKSYGKMVDLVIAHYYARLKH